MKTPLFVALGLVVVSAQSPSVQIQNGKVEVRKGAAIDREIASIPAGRVDDATWVAWKVPMVAGDRDMCSWYSDRLATMRGMSLHDGGSFYVTDGVIVSGQRPQITPPTGPMQLEGGTNLVVLARIVENKVERLRTAGDDCPLDAGGRSVHWLDAITPAESLRFLGTLVSGAAPDRAFLDAEKTVAQNALSAIGYHRDASADSALDQIASSHRDSDVRRQAASTLGRLRGARGIASLTKLLSGTTAVEERRSVVTAIGQSREASAVEMLRGLTRDPDAKVRSEAVFYFVVRGGTATIPDALKIIASDSEESVRKRAVTAIGRLPGDVSVTPLLQLARTSENLAIRKEAVNQLSTSKDPRAIAYLEGLLK